MIKYKSGYLYQLARFYSVEVPIKDHTIDQGIIRLTPAGILIIKKGYAWDGPSGPAIDTKNFMRGSLVHDALYQLMREGLLDAKQHRDTADRLLQKMCIEDGMWRLRAWWVYQAVKRFGSSAADPENKRPVLVAP